MQKKESSTMATSASPLEASPASPSPSIRAHHSGVSVLEHLGDDAEMNSAANNSVGTAAASESLPSDVQRISKSSRRVDINAGLRPSGWCGPRE